MEYVSKHRESLQVAGRDHNRNDRALPTLLDDHHPQVALHRRLAPVRQFDVDRVAEVRNQHPKLTTIPLDAQDAFVVAEAQPYTEQRLLSQVLQLDPQHKLRAQAHDARNHFDLFAALLACHLLEDPPFQESGVLHVPAVHLRAVAGLSL